MTRRRVTQSPRLLSVSAAALALPLLAVPAAGAPFLDQADPADRTARPALGATAEGTAYVALGDSFSAGTGTRASTDDCYRSPYGYPVLIAQGRGLDLDYQACSGATVADVHANQLAALSAGTDHVTMTIGGNDLGFADVITQCALPGWLSDCDGRINGSLDLLRTTMPGRYDTLFDAVAARAPEADVVIGSYPRLFNGTDCALGTFFSGSEMSRLNSATDELAGTIRDRTRAAGFRYVDPRSAFSGHAVCDDVEWVNGLSWPIVESFHPNREGNVGYAEVFWPGSATAAAPSATTTSEGGLAGAGRTDDGLVDVSHADDIRAQADAVLAMHLTSQKNLATARAEGVDTGEITRLVAQLRSGDTAVVERALNGLARLDRQHEAQTTS